MMWVSCFSRNRFLKKSVKKSVGIGAKTSTLLGMFFRGALAIFLVAGVSAHAAGPVLPRSVLKQAAVESATDNISSGWCGRGIFSILNKSGLGARLQPGNGQDWEGILTKAGWKPLKCVSPLRAPLGSVLVYLGDARLGKRPRGTPGGRFGHVEMVALGPNGSRLYVADSPRPRPGGTVLDNFTGRAWLPPGPSIWQAPAVQDQVAVIMRERKKMAMTEFSRRRGELTAVTTTLTEQNL